MSAISRKLEVKVRLAVDEIITRHPFFASTLLKHKLEVTDVPTACVDGRGRIQLGAQFIEPLSAKQLVFLLAHECLHPMSGHPWRRGKRDPAKWNWAGDAYINEVLIASGIGEFIEGGVRYPGAQDMSADHLYKLAPERPKGGGGGSLGADLDSSTDDMSAEECEEAIAKAEADMARAAMAAKAIGKLPAPLQRLVDDILNPPTPWYDVLAPLMMQFFPRDYDWTVPDEYFLQHGIYLPDMGGVGAGEIVLVKDESGSISDRETAVFSGHFGSIMTSCEPETVHVLHTSTRVEHVSSFTPDDFPSTLPIRAGGGTYMPAGIEYAQEHFPAAEACIVLTDGYTDFGSPSHIPVIWLITTPNIVAPHGKTIYCDLSEVQ